ncbi:ABC transporter [Loktanella sp. 1ANDIMAR09]|nr:ABC transporter [Loktanella sp. 1ANDIMAR09]
MSGLLALLDDVAAIAKLAAAQLDDIAAQASKAGVKAAGVVIDDAAVTPKYVTGLPAARELPIVWKIARASFFNKLVILLPAALLLQAFAPWLLTPLLMLGGAYLCFEGAEKVWHLFAPHKEHGPQQAKTLDAAHLEEQRVKGAIKTDFILSAEIMTISLSQIDIDSFWIQAAALAAVAIGITALVYGAVALLVKADDFGMLLSARGRLSLTRAVGRGIVKSMPATMIVIATIGTVAMLWVGGSILVHGIRDLGWAVPYDMIKHAAQVVADGAGTAQGFLRWFVTAGLDGIIGLAAGFVLIPIVLKAVVPTVTWLFPEKA